MTNRLFQFWCGVVLAVSTVCWAVPATAASFAGFTPVPTQYIAALVEPGANSGTGAENWGLWRLDPGPRGVHHTRYHRLQASNGIAPARWKFSENDWWLDENGLLMEAPEFGMPAGRYVVTGNREVTTILTVHPKDASGGQRWELADAATIYDVTHLRCRSARYTPRVEGQACSPVNVQQSNFPLGQAEVMPIVGGCDKQDYTVLFIVGVE